MDGLTTERSLRTQETINEKRQTGVPAFKEWAIVCSSIERGETSLIFRKGGIAEGLNGFQFKHRHFFLFPTYFHEQIEQTRLNRKRDLIPRKDCVAISVFVEAEFATPISESFEVQIFAQGSASARTMVVFGQGGLEIGRGDMVWTSLVPPPLHEEAIAQAQHHCHNQHNVVVAHPAAVVVVGDIQTLMQTVLNAPGIPVQTQPVCRIQSPRLNTGNERHQFVFTAFGLAQQ